MPQQSSPWRVLLPCLIWCAVWCAANSPSSAQDWSSDRFRWLGEATSLESVSVHNPYGDVRARNGADAAAELSAIIQRRSDYGHDVDFKIEESDGRLVVEVVFPETAEELAAETAPGARTRRRVDLTIFVPAGALFEVETTDGLIEAKKLKADVEARSVSGEIRVLTAQSVRAHTESGDLSVVTTAKRLMSPVEVSTSTGAITVEFSYATPVAVDLETRGRISTDYSIEIVSREGSKQKIGKIVSGDKPTAVRARSEQGDIAILRSPFSDRG